MNTSTTRVVITMTAEQTAQSLAAMKETRERWLELHPELAHQTVNIPVKRTLFQKILRALIF